MGDAAMNAESPTAHLSRTEHKPHTGSVLGGR